MPIYNERTVANIIALIEEGNHSISSICKVVGIGRKTFYDWKNNHPEFLCAIEDAEQRRTEELMELANKALRKKLEGYYETVSRTVYISSEDEPETLTIKQHTVTTKFCEPDTKTIMEVMGIRTSKKKKRFSSGRNQNPALIVKQEKQEIEDNAALIPPFTIKAKEVVELGRDKVSRSPIDKENEDEQIISPSVNLEIKETDQNKLKEDKGILSESNLDKGNTLKENEFNDNIKEMSKNTVISTTQGPLPPGYTRRA